MNQKSPPDFAAEAGASVLCWRDAPQSQLRSLFRLGGLEICQAADRATIPGSFWGEPEAGLIDAQLYVRNDTPVHSALHEACHFFCMPRDRREGLHTNAGGDYDEENAVCYLQILLAATLTGISKQRIMADMDCWGYSFRLGSAKAWFEHDADDSRNWLMLRGLINRRDEVQWRTF